MRLSVLEKHIIQEALKLYAKAIKCQAHDTRRNANWFLSGNDKEVGLGIADDIDRKAVTVECVLKRAEKAWKLPKRA
jgi:hypothetical protein